MPTTIPIGDTIDWHEACNPPIGTLWFCLCADSRGQCLNCRKKFQSAIPHMFSLASPHTNLCLECGYKNYADFMVRYKDPFTYERIKHPFDEENYDEKMLG